MTPRERLVVALDVASAVEGEALASRLAGAVGMFKVGSQLFTAAGPALVRSLVERGERVFLDLKYHDIPNTVSGAVAAAGVLGVSLVTIHALGGAEMLRAAVQARPRGIRLLAITVLTSHDEASLLRLGIPGPLPDQVRRLALVAREAGLDGVVASPHEVALVRSACGPDFLVVTPGIRPDGAGLGDQARAATPRQALASGADYLVVGRPITGQRDPRAAAHAIVAEMEGVARSL
ncbi:MAG TPA: orotidine-5'-phosphate decarboxylase [Vicinamibacteria bacterium]|nr:orotidine-5'-phosphate decarboxylase [Vicinamibacteria bacterium]